ncbi:hypothetical protein L195_g062757, partial [Trifolium pratense]
MDTVGCGGCFEIPMIIGGRSKGYTQRIGAASDALHVEMRR